MARQAATSRKRASAKVATPASRNGRGTVGELKLDGLAPEQKISRLMADREQLVARISDLEVEVAQMKAVQAEVADRISWTLDSLRDLLGPKN